MKPFQTIPRAAFTLIELLVVISIIAVLASLAIPTANIVMRKAKEAQAKATMAGLIIGIKAYQTEYNRFPDPSGGSQGDAVIKLDGQGGDNDLIKILHPDQSVSPPQGSPNPRRINFYDPQPAKNYANGLTPDNALNDPWSSRDFQQHYNVAMDYSGDGAIEQNLDPTGGSTNIETTVIAWSPGQPVKPGTENAGTDAATSKYFLCSWK